MHKYELVCIVQSDLDETAFNGIIEKVKGWVSDSEGSVDKVDIWGKRRLAYEIRKQRDGQYVLFNITMPPTASATLERNLRFLEPVIRYMIVVLN